MELVADPSKDELRLLKAGALSVVLDSQEVRLLCLLRESEADHWLPGQAGRDAHVLPGRRRLGA